MLWFQVKDLARFKPMQRHLFLYDKMLLFCKKREETADGHEKNPSYSFKHSLKVPHTRPRQNRQANQRRW